MRTKRGARRQSRVWSCASKTAASAHNPSLLRFVQSILFLNRVEVEQRWSWQYRDALTYLDAADVEAGAEGGLHDNAWRTASGDLLHRFPIVGALHRLQDLRQETDTVTGLNGHFKSS